MPWWNRLLKRNRKKETKDIAVIGLAGKFPGAKSIEQFWENLCLGKESITFFSDTELLSLGIPEHIVKNPQYVKASPILDNIDLFDAKFFKYSPHEAELIDPQQRLLLECAWETLENAGYSIENYTGEIGIFCGSGGIVSSYFIECLKENSAIQGTTTSVAHLGNDKDFLSTRVSYKLNLKGPSLDIQSACSTSLVTVHLACQSILNGECDMALAGGVSVRVPQKSGYFWSKGEIFSSDGHTRPFDDKAEGIVFGSGLGLVLLKKLDRAIEDHDHIYAVIKGSAINNDGGNKVSYMAASSTGQIKCIAKAFDAADINPESISYVEAHGTGTAMGDKVEVSALSQIFRRFTQKIQYCAIGSVKSNVGHLDTASGIASLIKTILSLYYKKIPPTINFTTPNRKIDFEVSPFFVNKELINWENKDGVRRAGVNSLGIGGTNAFMILEEAPVKLEKSPAHLKKNYVVTFSAKNEKALKQKIIDFDKWLNNENQKLSLADVSYTLNCGRTHFNKRNAMVVSSISELKEALLKIIKNESSSNIFTNVDSDYQNKNDPAVFNSILNQLLAEIQKSSSLAESDYREKLLSLANFYILGCDIDWRLLYQDEPKNKIPLPTYPFQGERFWVEHKIEKLGRVEETEKKFTKMIAENEFLMAEHLIYDVPVLPGVVHLALAKFASEKLFPDQTVLSLKNIVWTKPIQGSGPQNITINLSSEYPETKYEITTNVAGKQLNHSQGKVVFQKSQNDENRRLEINLDSIKNRCKKVESPASIYQSFRKLGFMQGYNFQVIQSFCTDGLEALSHIKLPDKVKYKDEFGLDVRLLDGAVQTAFALLKNSSSVLYVPFSIARMDIYKTLKDECNVHVVMSPSIESKEIVKFDIQIVDSSGKLVVNIKDFSVRPFNQLNKSEQDKLYYYHPVWKNEKLPKMINRQINPILIIDSDDKFLWLLKNNLPHQIIINVNLGKQFTKLNDKSYCIDESNLENYSDLLKELTEKNNVPRLIYIYTKLSSKLTGELLNKKISKTYQILLNLSKSLIQLKVKDEIQICYIIEGQSKMASLFSQAFSAFAKTLQLEYPKIRCKSIIVNGLSNLTIENIQQEVSSNEFEIRYKNDIRFIKHYEEVSSNNELSLDNPLKHHGVYLITGGLGGLGKILARYLSKNYKAKLILTGRSKLNKEHESVIDEINQLGGEALYFQSDITDLKSATELINKIKERFNQLNGVFHCAGIINDSFILKKELNQSLEVLAPKILGTLNLDEATKKIALDIFVMFSSVSSIFGNVGQCDYAFGNGFMDGFANYRERLRKKDKRQGKTISINWPVWADGGMQININSEEWMRQTLGLIPISTENGLHALSHVLSHDYKQQLVLTGDKNIIAKKLSIPTIASLVHTNHTELLDKILATVMQMVSELLKIKINELHAEESLSNYGVDSVSLTALSNQLNSYYGLELTPAILFEYNTLKSFAQFLLDDYRGVMEEKYHTHEEVNSVQNEISEITPIVEDRYENNDIAIIGMSGKFPGSTTLEVFWNNLVDKKNLITTIPNDRWDWKKYYGDVEENQNKTKIKWGGFIDDVDKFDAEFFNISPYEAELMDPQQRIFLETVWNAIEDSAYNVSELHDIRTGLFVGVFNYDYSELLQEANEISGYVPTGVFHSVLANRVSYLLNLTGPSEAIDTACSSSLVAVHHAVNAIRNGDCDVAIAGGINLMLTPRLHVEFNLAGMLSEDGTCHTFDESANGYVRGEGVGAILLKSLTKAKEDGDIIYGVIKGSAVNHGGHVNSLTVPNPNAQAEVIVSACKRANIDVDTISYIEAHGTGTYIGDPIEVNGLKKAFTLQNKMQNKTDFPHNYCGLGSVKTNIGHLESAAGIASVIKVVLAMKHKTLPGLANFKKLNPQIKIESSPFYVVENTQEWKPLQDNLNQIVPRRAGISSFGFGGSNAHVLLEEMIHLENNHTPKKLSYLVTLSAKTEFSLKKKLEDLETWLKATSSEPFIEDLSYTLNAKRMHFDKRCVFIVDSVRELQEAVSQVNQSKHPENYINSVTETSHEQSSELEEYENNYIEYKNNLRKIAENYVRGAKIDWEKLHKNESKKRISLPGYPFLKTRYWVPTNALKPFLDENKSENDKIKFVKVLNGNESYLRDHMIGSKVMLPAAVYLEMAIEAGHVAFNDKVVTGLRNVIWAEPIIVDKTTQISIDLYLNDKSAKFEISSLNERNNSDQKVQAQGKIILAKNYQESAQKELDSIKKKLSNEIKVDYLYQRFATIGIHYGETFQVIKEIYANESESIAKIEISQLSSDDFDKYYLHPNILDGAFQAILPLIDNTPDKTLGLFMPFSIGELIILGKTTKLCYAHVVDSSEPNNNNLKKFQIDIMDMSGQILIQIKDFVVRYQHHTIVSDDVKTLKITSPLSDLQIKTEDYLKKILANSLKILPEQINPNQAFERFGINSIMIMNLNRQLEKIFGDLSKTLFFEYQTLRELAKYFAENHLSTLNKVLATQPNVIIPDVKKRPEQINITSENNKPANSHDIAIIGISGRYPDANDLDTFWENLKSGRDSIIEIPKDRWDYHLYYDPDKNHPGKSYSKWGSFIDDVDKFDPLFFNISPREAQLMDPQERLFLETTWHALEDAGYAPKRLSNKKVGVFVGVMYGDYQLFGAEETLKGHTIATSSSYASIANRISYFCNFQGPSIALDTMCSSSITSVYLACNSLINGECELAIAGGVNVSIHPNKYILLSQGKFLSSDGHCNSFGEGGDGYVPGEGVGAVLLKPLQRAIADGDHIYGVIKSISINHGGKTNSFTVPSPNAQSKLIEDALQKAQVEPNSISYIEAHGTGTTLGDPIEITGLNKVYGENPKASIAIGSVKSNIGHLESAAGIVGLTKVLLQLKNKMLVPSIHSEVLNPNINFDKTPFIVQQKLTEWKPIPGYPRRAGLSSFGAGGSNAHMIIEEAPELVAQLSSEKPYYIITLSAKDEIALKKQLQDLEIWLVKQNLAKETISLENISFTLNVGREDFESRLAMVVNSISELQETVKQINANNVPTNSFLNLQFDEQDLLKNEAEYNKAFAKISEKLAKFEEIEKADYQATLMELARLYVKGYEIDWNLVHIKESNRRISLPTYRFAKDRYWFEKPAQGKISLKPLNNNNVKPLILKQSTLESELPKLSEVKKPLSTQSQKNIKESVCALVSEVLYIPVEKIPTHKKFAEMGMDSVLGVELINKINKKFNLNLFATKLYDLTTIDELSNYISTQLNTENKAESSDQVVKEVSQVQIQPEVKIEKKHYNNTDIAIIGIACQFPGAKNKDKFWHNLASGKSSISEIPKDRWSIKEFYNPDPKIPNKSYSKWGGFIKEVDQFDPLFFSISPEEAKWMDPQQRLFLQTSWAALEDAGYSPKTMSNMSCGVYVGVMNNDYAELIAKNTTVTNAQQMMGNSNAILAGRVSYLLNLKGPALTLDTACSSSLVAIHLACNALISNEAKMMLVGGVTLYLTETPYIEMSKAEMLSSDGKCKTFDNSADGFVPGEGVGVVILKKLNDAVKDHDHIYGVIKGSGTNQDGASNGITAPSIESQKELEINVYKKYEINPTMISYVEAHGTGTKLGDPIEVEALTHAFRAFTNAKQFSAIGSVKTNIGHTSAAAGVASLIKVLLSFENNKLVPTLNYSHENKLIKFNETPFYVNTELKEWDNAQPRLAAISSFGFSGTNAHVVLGDAPDVGTIESSSTKPMYLFTLSAKTKESLIKKIIELDEWLTHNKEAAIENVSFTLNAGREHFEKRCAIVAANLQELQEILKNFKIDKKVSNVFIHVEDTERPDDDIVIQTILNKILESLPSLSTSEYHDNLLVLAKFYVKGYELNWHKLHESESQHRIPLPTYPFSKKKYWIDKKKSEAESVVSDLYDGLLTETKSKKIKIKNQKFLTFGPLDHVIPSFSWSSAFIVGGKNQEILIKSQKAMRDILFRHVDFSKAHNVLDFGCGYGNDLIDLAKKYSHLQLVGYTLSKEQVEVATININKNNLNDRIVVYQRDSAVQAFPDEYDVIFGFEVVHHIKNKNALFENISNHLKKHGKLIIADFISHTDFPIEHQKTGSYFMTQSEWVEILTQYNLQFVDCVDISKEISNFLHDPDFENNLALITNESVRDAFISYHQLHRILQQKLASYVLLTIVPATDKTVNLKHINSEILKNVIPYKEISSVKRWFYQVVWKDISPVENKNYHDVSLIISNQKNKELAEKLQKELKATLIVAENQGQLSAKITELGSVDDIKDIVIFCSESDKLPPLHNEIDLLSKIKLISDAFYTPTKIWFIRTESELDMSYVSAMATTFSVENPLFSCTTLIIDNTLTIENRVRDIKQVLLNCAHEAEVKVSRSNMKAARLVKYNLDKTKQKFQGQSDATCLITGGLGGLGMKVMSWFAKKGVKHFLLLNRHPPSKQIKEQLNNEKMKLLNIHIAQVDVSDQEQLEAILHEVKHILPPIEYVVHAAGVIDDAAIENQDAKSFEQVFLPKVKGAWNLHLLTQSLDLKCFVLFSSVASILGSSGQINYAAANAFLDSLAMYRKSQGLPGISINWGPWSDIGMVSKLNRKDHLSLIKKGVFEIAFKQGLKALSLALIESQANLFIAAIDWLRYFKTVPYNKFYENIINLEETVPIEPQEKTKTHKDIHDIIKKHVSKITGIELNEINNTRTFAEMGIDSVMLVDLRNRIQNDLGKEYKFTANNLYEYPSIEKLSDHFSNTVNRFPLPHSPARNLPSQVNRDQREWGVRKFKTSFGQERMYFAYLLEPAVASYNCSMTLHFEGELDVEALKNACNDILDRHEILKSTYQITEENITGSIDHQQKMFFKCISAENYLPIYIAIANITKTSTLNAIQLDCLAAFAITSKLVDLATGPVIRFNLIKVSDTSYYFIITMHHIVIDGISYVIFMHDLTALYNAHVSERKDALPYLPLQYFDFAEIQREWIKTPEAEKQLSYWKNTIPSNVSPLNLPTNKTRNFVPRHRMEVTSIKLSNELVESILNFNKENNVSLFTYMFSVYQLWLAKWSEQKEFIIGLVTAGRNNQQIEHLIGFFLNILPIPVNLNGKLTFIELMARVNNTLTTALANQDMPIEVLLSELKLVRKNNSNPLFQTAFVFQNYFTDIKPNLIGLETTQVDIYNGITNDDIVFEVRPREQEIELLVKYNTDLFESSTMDKMNKQLVKLMQEVLLTPQQILFTKRQISIAATFTSEPIKESLEFWLKKMHFDAKITFAQFNQVFQEILNTDSQFHKNKSGINIALIRLEDWLSHTFSYPKLQQVVNEFKDAVRDYSKQNKSPLFIYIAPPSPQFLSKFMEKSQYEKLETDVKESLKYLPGIYFISNRDMKNYYVKEYYDAVTDISANVPYTRIFYTSIGTLLSRKIHALYAKPYKVIVLDGDNTLWHGILGEDGIEGVKVTAPYQFLQKFMVNQHEAGMLICICSKNNEEDVIAFFDHHPESMLKKSHLTSWKIAWQPKSIGIKQLAKELKLSLDSFIFIDDNIVECEEVKANCPGVLTLQLPTDATKIPEFLYHIWAFDHLRVTETDKERTQLYQQQISREKMRSSSSSFKDFIESLQLEVILSDISDQDIPRVAQLTQRTSQFNMTNLRKTENEIKDALCITASVKDRFGSYGLVGAVFYEFNKNKMIINNFLLSCRVLGKGVEHYIVSELGKMAKSHQCSEIIIHFIPTERNTPAKQFLDQLPLINTGNNEYSLTVDAAMTTKFSTDTAVEVEYNESTLSQKSEMSLDSEIMQEIVLLTKPKDIFEKIHTEKRHARKSQTEVVYPKSNVEKLIANIFCNLLHVDEISVTDNFFDLGVTSLMVVLAQTEINKKLNYEIPLIEFFNYPNVAAISSFINNEHPQKTNTSEQRGILELNARKLRLHKKNIKH